METKHQEESPRPSLRERLVRFVTHTSGVEVMQQFVAPLARLTISTLEETQKLQKAWWSRLQEATQETQDLTKTQMQRLADLGFKTNEILREQLQKLSKSRE